MIQISDLSKVYPDGTQALNGVTLQVRQGEQLVLLGHNGCGKSTLMKCLTGLEKPSSGKILLDQHDIHQLRGHKLRKVRQGVGCVFQQMNLVLDVSVLQNVLYGAMAKHGFWRVLNLTASRTLREQALWALEQVGLAELAARRTDMLSGGQQQRVAIARMLMQQAKIVFADEPVASLDPKAGREVMELLQRIVVEHGMTLICVLHQLDLAMQYGHRLVGMKKGKIVFDDTPDNLPAETFQELYHA
ncbi:phosphonate ABC transporter ATP-binding protein [Alkalimonas amylolytica]|uniref:Phosphonate transport system ATP-binding protein n=1 Tax=Alkalimonas amylolytica TaxID=152573 RepID=A0A1H4DZH9_ALKAM|nr:phosphonate ABC transporter ATP-binding protein [Alkalimonas amylolytica]SEA77977.1 phosphonate transport system ATP-binding protein [Alkalimonas amylolytica]